MCKTSRQLKGHFATWHAAIFHLTSPPFSSISPCENQLRVISTLPLSFFGMHTLRIRDISIHHRFRNRGAPMLVPHVSVWPDFFRPKKALEIRSASVEDRGQMWRGDRAVGKITRTAAGGAATLTIVWQEFRFRLCTTLLFSCSPSSPLRHTFSLPDSICMDAVDSSIFNHLLSQLKSCLSFSVSLPRIPSLPFCQSHNTHSERACSQFLKVRFDVTASGRGGGWEERASCLSWP